MIQSKQSYLISCVASLIGLIVSYLCNTYYHLDSARYLWLACIFWLLGAVLPSIILGIIFKTYRKLTLAPLVVIVAISVLYFGNGQNFAVLAVGVGITFSIAVLIPHIWASISIRRGK